MKGWNTLFYYKSKLKGRKEFPGVLNILGRGAWEIEAVNNQFIPSLEPNHRFLIREKLP
jgi:hypothetical protein